MSVIYTVKLDRATPALERLLAKLGPGGLARAVGPACAHLTRVHLRLLPDNENHWPSTGFWNKAANSVRWQVVPEGVRIQVHHTGVRQRYYGGPIRPRDRMALTIPASAEAYGKTAAEFPNLRFSFMHGPGSFGSLIDTQTRRVMFWLSRGVSQRANPAVLPTPKEMAATAKEAILKAVKQGERSEA
jgi:hypothetical protein